MAIPQVSKEIAGGRCPAEGTDPLLFRFLWHLEKMHIYRRKRGLQIDTPDKLLIGAQENRSAAPVQLVRGNEDHAKWQVEQIRNIGAIRWPLGRNQSRSKGNTKKYLNRQHERRIGREFIERRLSCMLPTLKD